MKLKEEKYAAESTRAMNMLGLFDRGADIGLEHFEAAFGVTRDCPLFRYLVRKIEKRLWREQEIRMMCVNPGSQRKLRDDEWHLYHNKQRRKRHRSATKDLKTMRCANPSAMPDALRRARLLAIEGTERERLHNARTRNTVKKTEVNPVRKIG